MTLELTTAGLRQLARARRLLLNLALVVLALFALLMVAPAALGLERFTVVDSAMDGTIGEGAAVFTRVTPVSDLRVGDILVYLPPSESGLNEPITRRIADIDKGLFQTRGDAEGQLDPWQFRLTEDTQAKAVFDVPVVGSLLDSVDSGSHRFWLVGVPSLLIALLAAFEFLASRRRTQTIATAVESDEGRIDLLAGTKVTVRDR